MKILNIKPIITIIINKNVKILNIKIKFYKTKMEGRQGLKTLCFDFWEKRGGGW